jgi:hypothetical protein
VAQARKTKLKVFRTPIGFHDAYVAAPSQKAALEAWGSDSNLFAAGAAEQVTEPELMEAALARPGEVIKVLRGSKAEQVAALGKIAAQPGKKKGAVAKAAKAAKPKPPKPSRAAVDEAEEEAEELRRQQAKELAAIDDELAELERKRRETERRQRRELRELEQKLERERARYERAVASWRKTK